MLCDNKLEQVTTNMTGPPWKITPSKCLKLVIIMLETWNLERKYTHSPVVSENIPVSAKALLILLMSAFFVKN